jgi:energy-coupling factor transporter ATP-binding protein EcfA2
MATIRRVTFHRLRNVKPGCTLELHRGLNVLLGQNGTGKTTLLQWMADFLSNDLKAWDAEPYQVELDFEISPGNIHVIVDNQLAELAEDREASAELTHLARWTDSQARSSLLTFEIAVESSDERYEIQARSSHLTLRANGKLLVETKPTYPPGAMRQRASLSAAIGDAYNLARRTRLSSKQADEASLQAAEDCLSHALSDLSWSWNVLRSLVDRFDESLGFFDDMVEEGLAKATYVEMFPMFSFKALSRRVPDEIVTLLKKETNGGTSTPQTLAFTSRDVQGFLAAAVRLFGYRSAVVHLALLEKDGGGQEGHSIYGNVRFTFERHDSSIFGHDKLSFGQKRMLAFLYYLAINPRIIIVDELVNGLHHAWIEACIEEIGDRQGILTSQNPLLLDYLTFESADEVRQRFVLCRSERDDETGREQLIWRNPTQEEAESFFSAYQAGIQHVGEILVDKGFW